MLLYLSKGEFLLYIFYKLREIKKWSDFFAKLLIATMLDNTCKRKRSLCINNQLGSYHALKIALYFHLEYKVPFSVMQHKQSIVRELIQIDSIWLFYTNL